MLRYEAAAVPSEDRVQRQQTGPQHERTATGHGATTGSVGVWGYCGGCSGYTVIALEVDQVRSD